MCIPERKHDKIAFQPLTKKQKDMIVGIDSRTTIDIADLDLGGNFVYLANTRLFSSADLNREIANLEKPPIIASNKAEMPFGVKKILCSFSAITWDLKKDGLIKDKRIFTRDHNFKNDHERDSLSEAMRAYRIYKNRFESIIKRSHQLRRRRQQNLINPNETTFDKRDDRITQQKETI